MRLMTTLAALACGCAGSAAPGDAPIAPAEPAPLTADALHSDPVEYRARPISAEAGRDYFTRTGVGDPYAAGFPYPVFLALMQQFPDRLGGDWATFNRAFGTIPGAAADADPTELPIGFHLTTDPNTQVPFVVMNCQICHTARLRLPDGDRVVVGMGNKRLRLHAYDRALTDIARDPRLTVDRVLRRARAIAARRGLRFSGEWDRALVAATIRNLKHRAQIRGAHVDQLGDGTPGRVATIAGFVMALNLQYDAGLDIAETPGWVKIPDVAVWRYRDTNSFDGVVSGSPVALVAGADFAFGVRPRWYQDHRHIATSMFLYLRAFERDLPFPGAIDPARARRGYDVFHRACADCHGSYAHPDRPGARLLHYREHIVDWEQVETDRARLDAVTPEFVRRANAIQSTAGLTVTRATGGYVPRPLIGVWARGLYGHNGQWPSIEVLAMPPQRRPQRFFVDPDQPYDVRALGTRWRPADASTPRGSEYLYDGTRPGFGVGGHGFVSDLPEGDRRSLIEYLKTL